MKVVITENDVSGATMPPFFAKNHVQSEKDFFKFSPNQNVISFAQHAKDVLKRNCPAAVCCPVLRVDIFETQCGTLVVNEFGNLDALVQKSGQVDINNRRARPDTDVLLSNFRRVFFVDKIRQLVQIKLSSLVD